MTSATPRTDDVSTRERILDVALASFAELGFDGSSTRAIAARAGVNQGLIPYYFGTKDALWREAVARCFARLAAAVGRASDASASSTSERLARVIRRYVHFVAAHPEFAMLMNEEGKRESERMHWLVDNHVRPIFESMTLLHERARKEGGLPGEIGPPHFHYIFAGAVGILFHQAPECRRLFGIDPTVPEVVEAHADAVVRLLVGDASLGREPSPDA